ncbi:MAG: CDP-2,3-bis-(O-geranylgeranyl)-sn-glycerol synthase [Candidatus Diapherotrites archaeon]|nr:CDP-2,3-bis-(O-geranylgeranyl)-sn-glycerol synthase [Candidatus Diapherotrites archaeon]
MMDFFQLFWIQIILVLIPMYVANSSAMIFGGGKTQLDFGIKWRDGQPLFGKGKTWRGVLSGIACGTLAGAIVGFAFPGYAALVSPSYGLLSLLLSMGAITGDAVAGFFKRRNKLPPGEPVLFLDQLDFVIGGMVFGIPLFVANFPSFYQLIALALITLLVHRSANFLAFKLHLKRVPW